MKKELFTEIRDTLMDTKTVNAVKLWKNNILKKADIISQLPLAFLQFDALDYKTMVARQQECNGAQVTVHIIYRTLDDEDTEIFDISQLVYSAMQAKGFERTNEIPDYGEEEVIDWRITFELPRFTDDGAQITYKTVPRPPLGIEN